MASGAGGDIPRATASDEPAAVLPEADGDEQAPGRLPPSAGQADDVDRYPERTAAAEDSIDGTAANALDTDLTSETNNARQDDDPALGAAAEPRALSPGAPRAAVDRYGRPLPTEQPQAGQTPAPGADSQTPRMPESATSTGAIPPAETQARVPAAAPLAPLSSGGADVAQPPAADGTGRPGDPRLSGTQAPALSIEKAAPPEIQIGKPAKFLIKVRNAGAVAAHGVEVHDTVPQGTQLLSTAPQATQGPEGELIWQLGTLQPGAEQTVELELMPTAEGEIGSVATVHFRAEASVRTMATKPMLELQVTAPTQVMKGQPVPLRIKIANPGSGAASGVILSESVPAGLSHPAGQELEFNVGTLKPGESRELELALVAAEPGIVRNVLSARGDANLQAEMQTEIEVIAPKLEVSLAGPKRRYLERNATHNISVSNPGTAAAKDIELVAVLPRELKFVSANNNGQFDAASHSVYWSLAELPPQETGTVTLTTLPVQSGDAKLLIKSRAQQDLSHEREEVVAIEGLAAINFQLSDASDPIEVGGQTTYDVRVTNQGTKAASNVRLIAILPAEMKGVSAEGPVRYRIEGQGFVFEPLKQLAPKAETQYRITVQAMQPGDLRLQVQIATDEIRDPITKEESTRVYGNE
jgi:uncharacterized repeat protein (TIGR01451 family)